MDFYKLVDVFDANNVSFVSVTQAFNTTNSMGRLTLNILLSFAQFEREVTGERIRDKFAASKKKGIWMGGRLTLGYDVQHRKLVVNPTEAAQVRLIFDKYLELKSVHLLKDYLNQNGYQPKSWVKPSGVICGAKKHSKKTVRTLLSNYLYLGKIKDKEQIHDGDHQAIIDEDLWNRVQAQIQDNSVIRRGTKNKSHANLFKGKLTDSSDNPFVTTYTKRDSKRYYYYLNKTSKLRIGVAELNTIITNVTDSLDISHINLGIEKLSKAEISKRYPAAIDAIMQQAITKVILHEEKITLMLDKQKLAQSICNAKYGGGETTPATLTYVEILEHSDAIEVTLNIVFRRYAGRKIGYSSTQGAPSTSLKATMTTP
jgi:DNA invertase Pin-like site-specific DNA recombinase